MAHRIRHQGMYNISNKSTPEKDKEIAIQFNWSSEINQQIVQQEISTLER